jgi:16S rRNA (cytosine1402-N4)-methyltransferase
MYHQPVLLKESIEGLNIRSDGIYVDLTYGGGGHAREILSRLRDGRLYAFDVDREAGMDVINDKRFELIRGNFRYAGNFLRFREVTAINGALADLGVSSQHFDEPGRGFSFRFDSMLDMRMNQDADLSAMTVVNRYEKDELVRIFRDYGEVRDAKRLADRIIARRVVKNIVTAGELVEAMGDCVPRVNRHKYLARVFQAMRIEVNDEINALKEMIVAVTGLLAGGGRFCVITYHSLEDRLVKNFFRSGNFEGEQKSDIYGNRTVLYNQVTKSAVTPAGDEIKLNNRARSARLRIAERIA